MNRKSYSLKPADTKQQWHIVDAKDIVLGRLASQVAAVLRGKHKPQFTPHMDAQDFVVVVNAEKIQMTGKKKSDKIYYRHSGYLGGISSTTAERLLEKRPTEVVRLAVQGMLPRGPLGRKLLTKLKLYAGSEHPHAAQNPEPLTIHRGSREKS